MLNKPGKYDDVQTYAKKERLPVGGYVLQIQGTKQENYDWGTRLAVRFDVAEGDYKDFYKKDYLAQDEKDRKWKGTYRITLPKNDGTEQDEWAIRKLKTFILSVEKSNPGFSYDWNIDEGSQLKNKLLGGIFNEKEYSFNGRNGFFTQLKYVASVDDIRNGTFDIPDKDLLEEKKEQSSGDFTALQDDDIPF